MPACPLAPPPPLFVVASPLEVPLWWLGLAAVLAVVGAIHGNFYKTRLRSLHPIRRRRIATWLFVAGDLCLAIAGVLDFLVLGPALQRLNAWVHAQIGRDYGHSCTLDALWPLNFGLFSDLMRWLLPPAVACVILGLVLVWTARIRYVDRIPAAGTA